MFDYFKRERAKLIGALGKLSNEELARDRGLSFGSMKDVLVHTVMVEDNWLHYRAAGLGTGTSLKLEDFRTLAEIEKYMSDVDAKTNKLFSGLTQKDLRRIVRRVSSDGKQESYALEQILYQVPIENIHHFGEIFAEFWKMGLDAPYYSYLAYSKDQAKT